MYIIKVEEVYNKRFIYGITETLEDANIKVRKVIENNMMDVIVDEVNFNQAYNMWVTKSTDRLFFAYFIPAKIY